jgi:enamine deaminase RidA (YjgF/YER057c/UK114 family)
MLISKANGGTSSARRCEEFVPPVQVVKIVPAVQHVEGGKSMDIQRINPREWNCSAAIFGDLVFLSGTVADNKSLPMKGQTEEVLRKIDAVLAKTGTNKSRILSATVYMADASLKDEMNEAWMAWVDRSNLPTRTAVGAVLTPGTLVEITVCAAK